MGAPESTETAQGANVGQFSPGAGVSTSWAECLLEALSEILVVVSNVGLQKHAHPARRSPATSWRTHPAVRRPTELPIHLQIMILFQVPPDNMTIIPRCVSSISRAEERMISRTRQIFFCYLIELEKNILVNLTKESAKGLLYIINMDYNLQKL